MKENLKKIVKILKQHYPYVQTGLRHHDAYQLLMSVILSAQCTDERVNMVTPVLFEKYPKVEDLAKAKTKDVEKIIKSTGFYKSKTKSLIESSKKIVKDFGGEVPKTMKELMTLRGVARKTANVMLGDYFQTPEGIVVDTHVKRLAYRIGFSKNTNPVKVEQDLIKQFPKSEWIWISLALIWHGRLICNARKPKCDECPISKLCPKNGVYSKNNKKNIKK